ncbi:hypothetical protein [Clostridium tertium]|uniref:hypothetical protein n=1 Tax=Clostridium tertium TaxID=1559 RepID=UPI001AE63771|nr:hypothetical protein [Clostridium tertium]MBP1869655.1 hypothetical protein [Clostridium tertium]
MNKNYEEFRKECIKAIEVLGINNRAVEIRMLKTKKGTISGYYENKEKLLKDIFRYDGVNNIFFTLNVFSEDLLARGKERLIEYASHTTSDSEITRREFLLIDVDPKRPAGVSSTGEELQSSEIVLREVVSYLRSEGFPEPVIACSGNGYHALYKVDLDNTKESTQLHKDFLYALDSKFSNDKAQVDKTTYNAARITKMYGTMACKGDSTESRPHRRSRIVQAPDKLEVVNEVLLKKVADLHIKKNDNDKKVKKVYSKSIVKGSINMEEWLRDNGLNISKVKEEVDRTVYVLETCPWNSNHIDKSASITQFHNGAISAKCHHDSCSHENWRTLKELYEPKASKNKSEYSEKGEEEAKKSHADIAIEQALGYEDIFFHNSVEETFVAVDKGNVYEVHRLEDKKYQMLLRKRFYDELGKAISKDNINQAIGVLEAKALYEGAELEVYKRCAEVDGVTYYDLCDKESTIIRIDENGWGVDDTKQMLFIRKNNMGEQVMPIHYDDLFGLLNKYFRFKSKEDRILHAVSLVTRLIADIPHPIEVIHGEKGASKTTTMRMNKSLIDPSPRDVTSMPKAIQDLAISINNTYMACYDNLDIISSERSDLLCIASTGGVYPKRKLYTNDEESMMSLKSKITLNGINVVAIKADLIDRCILLALERISESERMEERLLWSSFNEDKPKILGAILTALSRAKRIYPTLKLTKLGRMADFTMWGYAVAEALEIGGEEFLKAYLNNQKKANQEAVESNPVATALIKYMEENSNFTGTVTNLLTVLNQVAEVEQIDTTSKLWAKEPNVLSRRLNEMKSNLELEGIYYEITQRNHGRIIDIVKVPKDIAA